MAIIINIIFVAINGFLNHDNNICRIINYICYGYIIAELSRDYRSFILSRFNRSSL